MPMYQGFFDATGQHYPEKFMLSVRALDVASATEAFEKETNNGYKLTAVTETQGECQLFRFGTPFSTEMYFVYARHQRELPPLDKDLDRAEIEVQNLRAATPKEPDLDAMMQGMKPPAAGPFIGLLGWCALGFCISICVMFFIHGSESVKFTVALAAPALVLGFLLIATAWLITAINRIMIATQYQAELARHQSYQAKIAAAEEEGESIRKARKAQDRRS